MKKIVIIISVLFISACDKDPEPLPKLAKDAVILAFGDGLTKGVGASANHDYPRLLSELSQRKVINEGVSGELTLDAVKRLPTLLDEYHPQLMILIHGASDMQEKIPEQVTARNLDRMISEAKSRDIDVVMLGVPEPSLLFMESAEIYRHIAEGHEVLIDLETLPSILEDSNLIADDYPNDAGYRRLAAHIFNFLRGSGAL